MTYLLLPLTELAIDTIMVEGHLPPDSCLDQERVFDRFYKKNGKSGVFLLNILKITYEKYIFLESFNSKEHCGIFFPLYKAKLWKFKIFGPIFYHLKYDIFI